MMALVQYIFDNVCLVICVIVTFYFTTLQFQYFVSNDDIASISIRKFNLEPKDQYPTYTICLYGNYKGFIGPENLTFCLLYTSDAADE